MVFPAIISCNNNNDEFDATGNFEAQEVIISAEGTGRIVEFNIDEGNLLTADKIVGYIDTIQLHLRKKQLQYSVRAVLAKQPDALTQLSTIEEQIATAKHEKGRAEKLLKEDAATQKQLDDINAQINLLEKQLKATKSSLSITTQSLYSETLPLKAQIEQLEDQIKRSTIVNPINGTVLAKYAEENEMAAAGKALYKIADLSSLILRAYISGSQLSSVKTGQTVTVRVDGRDEDYKSYEGIITWIADQAEFTPKTIQSKDERANLVYAIKIKVKNDGFLKTGMYGEVGLGDEIGN
jgi:HlyD family secretion protein